MKRGAGHHARLLTAALIGAGGGTAPETTRRRFLSTNTRPLQAASIPTWLQQAYKIFSYTVKGPKFIVSSKSFSTIGSVMAMTTGIGLIAVNSDIALAESNQEDAFNDNTMDPSSEKSAEIEQLVKTERMKLDECLRKLESQLIIPPFTVTAKGQQVAIRFQLPTDCELSLLVVDVVSHLGLKNDSSGGSSEMILRAWDSTVARQFLLMHPKQSCLGEKANQTRDCEADDDSFCIVFFQPLIGSDNPEVEFLKKGSFSMNELDALINALRKSLATRHQRRPAQDKHHDFSPAGDVQNPGSLISNSKTVKSLEEMGVKIYGLNANDQSSAKNDISWDNLAGYHEQKREIEDTVLLALRCPEIYDNIAKATRRKFESNRPRAVLFEGPPGTGKTSCARVIASQAGVPLLYVPLEVVMSKYYGESERLLGSIFSLANEFPDGAIVFLDEIDSFAAARNSEMHEATRRILSVLLRQIDGFEQEKKVVVIGATNRTQDLDPALISRFDSLITFDLPDEQTREEIAAQYAKHLSAKELAAFARATEGMAGRDLRDICQQAERTWASKLIRGQVSNQLTNSLPPLHEYVDSAKRRQKSLFGNQDQRQIASPTKKWPSVLT